MILNPRKNSAITFPRVFRGFGQDHSAETATAHTARNAMPPVERHFFRERISSISGMLQNVTAKGKSRPDSTTNFDELGAPYYYSTRPSIDSLNLHAFQMDCEGKNERASVSV